MATSSAPRTADFVPGFISDLVLRHWGLLMLRGVAAIIFGAIALSRPGLTLLSLVLLFGTYAIADGIFAIAAAFVEKGIRHRWWMGLVGAISVIVGIATYRVPGLTGLLLLYYIAAWAIAGGALQIYGAIAVRKVIQGEWLLITGGVLSVIFGIVLLARPGEGALALITVIGAYAVIYGVLVSMFALRMRSFVQRAASAPISARTSASERPDDLRT
jgi:uncharacterized membrane protein HdeD (DUF308 family)